MYSYDQKCYDLGEMFLEDAPALNVEAHRDEMAKRIQHAIEDFLAELERAHVHTQTCYGTEFGVLICGLEGEL